MTANLGQRVCILVAVLGYFAITAKAQSGAIQDPPPTPLTYEVLYSEGGTLLFSVNENVTAFDYVDLFLDGGSSPYVCKTNDTFAGGQNYTCVIQGLKSNRMYNITLRGHNPDWDEGTEEANGLTELSEEFSIYQEGTFSVTCDLDSYRIDFYFGDLASSKTSVTTSTQTTDEKSEDGTMFDEFDASQSTWDNQPAFVSPTNIFKGYPQGIVVQNDSNHITVLASIYSFNDMPIYNGVDGSYDSAIAEIFNLTDKLVVSVSGSFDNGNLTSIQFEAMDSDQNLIESPCYGIGDCSGFIMNQSSSDEYFFAFAGKTNAEGLFVELTTYWATVSYGKYYVGIEECTVNTTIDWYDIFATQYYYTVSSLDACETSPSVPDSNHIITYRNTLNRNSSAMNSVASFGNGNMLASRQMSGVLVNIECSYDANGMVTSSFETKMEDHHKASHMEEIQFQMQFYTTNTFTQNISSQDPLLAITGERIYFGITFTDMIAMNLTLYAHMCYAKKDNNPEYEADMSDILVLEEEGCAKEDDSFLRMHSVRMANMDKLDPLSIKAFYWLGSPNDLVYLHCKVRACPMEDKDSCTAPECVDSRRQRREIAPDSPMETFVSSQPIIILDGTPSLIPGNTRVGKQMWLPMSVFCGVMAAFLLIILNAFRKLNKRNNLFRYDRMKDY